MVDEINIWTIMKERIINKTSRHDIIKEFFKFQPIIQSTKQKEVQSLKRPHIEQPRKESNAFLQKVQSFMLSDNNYYLGFGGLGDAILLLATCWNDSKAKVVFFANQQAFVKQFFDLFNIPVFLHDNIMGLSLANQVYNLMTKHKNFQQSAHLADNLYYGDWSNEYKYIPRINKHVPWKEKFGIKDYGDFTLILAPSGSHKDTKRQRFLTSEEYTKLTNKYLDLEYRVFACGSLSDFHFYKVIERDNFFWLSSDKIIDHKKNSETINLQQMLQVINGAKQIISTDTWLKSYSLLCDIPTTVIQTRWQGEYIPFGTDATDWIFLNSNLWPLIKLEKIEDLL